MKQRYLIIDKNGVATTTHWLLEPNWAEVLCVVDISTGRFTNTDLWPEDVHPKWVEVEEDNL